MAAPALLSTRLLRLQNCMHQLRCLSNHSRRCFISTISSKRHSSSFTPLHLASSSYHYHLTSCLAYFICHTRRACVRPAMRQNSSLYHYQATLCAQKSIPSGKAAVSEPGLSRIPEKEEKEGLNVRMLKTFGRFTGFYSRRAILTRSAMKLYADSIDNLDYEEFFRVAHLHVWFLMVRLKREGPDGNYIIKQVVSFFWKDVESRMREIGVYHTRAASQSLRELVQQFYGVTLAYEEGIVCDDKVLASAVWRNIIFDKEKDTDPAMLEKMVDYIRRQVLHMDSLESDRMMKTGSISLLPFSHRKRTSVY